MYQSTDFIAEELHTGERVVWSGRPDLAAVLCRGDLILVPLSILWSAMALSFAIPMFLHAREDPDALPFIIFFAFPFTVMVIYALIGRLIFRLWAKSRTYYVVTDERVLAITKRFGRSVHASFLDEIAAIKSAGSLHSSSTLWFGEPAWWVVLLGAGLLDSPAPSLGDDGPVAFYDIREAARVRELVMNRDSRT